MRTIVCVLTFSTAFALRTLPAQAPGSNDPSFNVSVSGSSSPLVFSTAIQPDGDIVVAGWFTTINNEQRRVLARLHPNGTLDTGFNPNLQPPSFGNHFVASLALQHDRKIIVDGLFQAPTTSSSLARLNGDGTTDTTFTPVTPGTAYRTTLQSDGRIIVVGNGVARLNPNGTADAGFNAGAFDGMGVHSAAVEVDGQIVIGGWFRKIAGVDRASLARLHANGALDETFNPRLVRSGAEVWVSAVVVQPDGKILIGGIFNSVNDLRRDSIVRLHPDGTLDTGFDPRILGTDYVNISSIALQADGRILIGGRFSDVNGQRQNGIARLDPAGSLDTTFVHQTGEVSSVAIQTDGKILVGGNFLRRLLNDPPSQTLTVARSAVDWIRGGSAPEVEQVTFDLSTNGGTSWTSLGAGLRIAGGWRRSGLSLPATGTIRARGRTTGGFHSGGSGLVEQLASFSVGSPFAEWKLAHLGNADAPNAGDPDFDGLRTILEYATGADPLAPTELPAAAIVGDRLALTFPRNTQATDVTLIVQGSDDLFTWTDLASSIGGAPMGPVLSGVTVAESGGGSLRTVEVRDLYVVPDSAHPRRFLRLYAAPQSVAASSDRVRLRHRRGAR